MALAIVEKLSAASPRAVRSPAFREIVARIGAYPVGSSAAEFDRYIQVEQGRWRKVIHEAGIKLD